MNHRNILSRAWTLVWHYRALWLFGFLFVLTGGEGGLRLSNWGGNGGGGQPSNPGGPRFFPSLANIDWVTVAWVVSALLVVGVILAIVSVIVRYIAETAMIAGVDEIETTGAPFSVRRGFQLGWSHEAWELFVTDLIVYIPLALGAIALILTGALPLLVWLTHIMPLGILATLITIGLEILVIFSLLVLTLALSLLMPFIRRRVVLAKQGVVAAIRQSMQLVRESLVDTGLMWLILTALRIIWGLVTIPAFIVIVIVAGIVGGIPAGIAYAITQAWVAPAIIGGILFLLVFVPCVAFLEGLFETYVSTCWTLTYRELSPKLSSAPSTPPVVSPSAPSPVVPDAPPAPALQ